MLVLQGSGVKSLHEQENLMSRFLLMPGSLAPFCTVLCALRCCWRCLEWFTGSLSVLGFNEMERIVWFVPSFKDVPSNSVNAFLSLCTMTLLLFSVMMCLFCCFWSSQSGPVCKVSGPCYTDTCIHGLTPFKADLGSISVVWVSVWAASLGSNTTLTKFLKKYPPSSYFAACRTLVRMRKISARVFF